MGARTRIRIARSQRRCRLHAIWVGTLSGGRAPELSRRAIRTPAKCDRFFVNLDWVRRSYFPQIVSEVTKSQGSGTISIWRFWTIGIKSSAALSIQGGPRGGIFLLFFDPSSTMLGLHNDFATEMVGARQRRPDSPLILSGSTQWWFWPPPPLVALGLRLLVTGGSNRQP